MGRGGKPSFWKKGHFKEIFWDHFSKQNNPDYRSRIMPPGFYPNANGHLLNKKRMLSCYPLQLLNSRFPLDIFILAECEILHTQPGQTKEQINRKEPNACNAQQPLQLGLQFPKLILLRRLILRPLPLVLLPLLFRGFKRLTLLPAHLGLKHRQTKIA